MDARERIYKLIVTGDNRLKQGVAPEKVRASFQQALELGREAGLEEAITPLIERAFGPQRDGDWRLVPTRANRMPTAASYLRRPGDSQFRAFKFDVLRIESGVIKEITTFGKALFPAFGLPPTL